MRKKAVLFCHSLTSQHWRDIAQIVLSVGFSKKEMIVILAQNHHIIILSIQTLKRYCISHKCVSLFLANSQQIFSLANVCLFFLSKYYPGSSASSRSVYINSTYMVLISRHTVITKIMKRYTEILKSYISQLHSSKIIILIITYIKPIFYKYIKMVCLETDSPR